MDANFPTSVTHAISTAKGGGAIPEKYWAILEQFLHDYWTLAQTPEVEPLLLQIVASISTTAPSFTHYHQAVRSPIDFYAMGIDLFRPIVSQTSSTLMGLDILEEIETKRAKGENAFLFANHQSEADPQLLSLLLEPHFPKLAEEMIFVAGERVVTDPLAIPFSMGRNLLCIYSKKYFSVFPEKKGEMEAHNRRSIQILSTLLEEGGKCIYIAPSGGRDRKGESGKVEVAPFDPSSIGLCTLLGEKASTPTSYYPLAIDTHHILPPPEGVQVVLGEKRAIHKGAIHAHFAPSISPSTFAHLPNREARSAMTEKAQQTVETLYRAFP